MRRTIRNSLCLSIALLLSASALAAAHAELVRSEPAANQQLAESPRQARLWFDEELDTRQSALKVFDFEGRQVDRGDGRVDLDDPDHASMIVSLPPLVAGVYSVRWKAVTIDDAGVTEGELDFRVGNAEPRAPAPQSEAPPALTLAAGAAVGLVIIAAVLRLRARRT